MKYNELFIYPGYSNHSRDSCSKDYIKIPLASTLITGLVGSGKTILSNNIVMQLITQYDNKQLDLYIWDGKATEYVLQDKHYASGERTHMSEIHVCSQASNALEVSFGKCVQAIIESINARMRSFAYNGVRNYDEYHDSIKAEGLPRIVYFIEEPGNGYYDEVPSVLDTLRYIFRVGDIVGVHTIISCQPYKSLISMQLPGTLIVTRLLPEQSDILFGPEVSVDIKYDKHGTAFIRRSNELIPEQCVVPFYDDRKLRQVVDGEIAPNGYVLNEEQRKELRKFINR